MNQTNLDKHLALLSDKTSSLDSAARELSNYPPLFEAECLQLTEEQLADIQMAINQSFEYINSAKINVINLADKLTVCLIAKKS